VDLQTIFINRIGVFHLVGKRKMQCTVEFFEWIPHLLEYGTYTMKSSNNELAKLTADFYAENDMTDYLNMRVVYLAYMCSNLVLVEIIQDAN
jgi:uncharacterized membrane protein